MQFLFKFWKPILLLFFYNNLFFFFLFGRDIDYLYFCGLINIIIFIYFYLLLLGQIFFNFRGLQKILSFICIFFLTFSIIRINDESLEGGHDPGSYMGYAAQISNNGTFKLTGDNLLTFPHYLSQDNEIIFQTKVFWPFYLSSFYDFFGIFGFGLSILSCIVIFLFLFNETLLLFGFSYKKRTLAFLLFTFSYFTTYFTSSAYSENLLILSLWVLIYTSVYSLINPSLITFLLGFFASTFIFITRPEGSIYFILFLFVFAYAKYKYFFNLLIKKYNVTYKKLLFWCCIFLLISFIIIYFLALGYNGEYYDDGRGITLQKPFYLQLLDFISVSIQYGDLYSGKNYYDFNGTILVPIFVIVSHVVAGSFFGICFLRRNILTSKKLFLLLFLLLPQVFFLLAPNIQLYLPWAFRRYWSGLMILGFILIVSGKDNFLRKVIFLIVFILNIYGTALISPKVLETNFLDKMISTQGSSNTEKPFVFLGNGFETYGTILTDYGYKKFVIIDRLPAKNNEVYSSILPIGNFLLITHLAPSGLLKELNKGNIFLGKDWLFNGNFYKLDFTVNKIPTFCYFSNLFGSKAYVSLNESFQGCVMGYLPIQKKNYSLNVYSINNYLKAQEDLNIYGLDRFILRM